MIEIKGLKKTFPGGTQAVRGVDLTVEAGELLALLGPNGAGKSTAIRACTTLSGFDDGRILVAGHDVDRDPQGVRRAIGYVAQSTGVDFFLTGRENLTLQGRLYRMRKRDIHRRVEELAAQFDLEEALDRPVSEYSGGMQRKLDIATALIHRPEVLFLDEPTLGLDTASRHALWQHIRQLNSEHGLTILLTTHYLEEADTLARRVAIMHQGTVKVVDTPEALKAQLGGDSVTVEFPPEVQAAPWLEAVCERLPVRRHIWEGERLHLYLPDAGHAIPQLVDLAREHGITLAGISLTRPSLDDVFLHYTGASLQRGEEETAAPWWEKWAGKGGGRWAKKWQQGEGDGEDGHWRQWQDQAGSAGKGTGEDGDASPPWPGQADDGGGGDWQAWQGGKEEATPSWPATETDGGDGSPRDAAGDEAWPGGGPRSAGAGKRPGPSMDHDPAEARSWPQQADGKNDAWHRDDRSRAWQDEPQREETPSQSKHKGEGS